MAIETRLTRRLGIRHPVVAAPTAFASGGVLAAAVASAGGLGFIGGGYGNAAWLDREFRAAGNAEVGCGFITWALRQQPELLEQVLAHQPKAVFLSFDDPEPFASQVLSAGVVLFCQVQTLKDAERAIDCGADVIVAQGAEAGGHGERRATMTLAPEVADLIVRKSPEVLLCAAGGIADGRGLAAAIMLGADGAVVGSRLWASLEALVHPNLHEVALAANGDDTVRQSVTDVARGLEWPERFDIRVVRNDYVTTWLGRESELQGLGQIERDRYAGAAAAGDTRVAAAIVGEATGLIHAIEPAGAIIERMVAEAEQCLKSGNDKIKS